MTAVGKQEIGEVNCSNIARNQQWKCWVFTQYPSASSPYSPTEGRRKFKEQVLLSKKPLQYSKFL